jgi:hypothetical protein
MTRVAVAAVVALALSPSVACGQDTVVVVPAAIDPIADPRVARLEASLARMHERMAADGTIDDLERARLAVVEAMLARARSGAPVPAWRAQRRERLRRWLLARRAARRR